MFINTYEIKGVPTVDGLDWKMKVFLTGNKIDSDIITEVQALDTYSQDICNNYVKVITNQKTRKFSFGFIWAVFIPMIWHKYSYKEYIVSKQDLKIKLIE